MLRTIVLTLFAAVLVAGSGCGETLKSGWTNFSAYYNTYYNAKEYFRDGRKAVRDQPRSLDPASPVRIHPPPAPAGKESFEQAIEKSSQILRRHQDSAWFDDALLLMGKSYYYLQDYAAAVKRFEQLQDLNPAPPMQQQATIWKGRTMLDLGVYSQGIIYLEDLLGDYPPEWPAEVKGELQILAGEHHVMLENREQASEYLSAALSNVSDRKLRGAAFFLYGQLLEWQDRLGEAYFSYSQVPSHFVGYEYDYWSHFKQAEVSRKQGNLEVALAIYRRLQHNGKYVDRREQLTFEVARTLEMQGESDEAEQHYRRLLYGEQASESRSLQTDIHYRLGKIQSEHYQNYPVAAAYFDTSASLRGQPGNPVDEEAMVLAEAFSQYTEIKQSIHRADSLLWLGSLPPQKLDSLLERMRATRRKQLLERQDEEEKQNRLINQPSLAGEADTTNRSTIYGFLNHRSQNLMDRAKAEFSIIWGERPLTDNWRRREAVRQATAQREEDTSRSFTGDGAMDDGGTAKGPLDAEAIPRTEAGRKQLKEERAANQYQLGNVLFLKLDQPDSARMYYHKVVNEKDNPALRPRAMYALYEVHRTMNRGDSLRYWADRIITDYPDSEFAQLVSRQDGNATAVDMEEDRTQKLREQFYAIESSRNAARATDLRSLALDHRSSKLAPHIHYRAIEAYIEQAGAHQWIADAMLAQLFTAGADTGDLFFEPESGGFASNGPKYTAARWDSVRSVLTEHTAVFKASPYRGDVQRLRKELKASSALSGRQRSIEF